MRKSQPNLIDRIIETIPGTDKANPKLIAISPNTVLTKDKSRKERQEIWNYRSFVSMLNYLVNTTHPELAYSVHQYARFCNEPKHSHEQAVKDIINRRNICFYSSLFMSARRARAVTEIECT